MKNMFRILIVLFLYAPVHAQIITNPYDPMALGHQEKIIRENGYRECILVRSVRFSDRNAFPDTSEYYYFDLSGRLEKRVSHVSTDTTYYYYNDAGEMAGDYRKRADAPYIGNYYTYDTEGRLRSVCNFFEQSMFLVDSVNAAGQVLSLTRYFVPAGGPVVTWMGIYFDALL